MSVGAASSPNYFDRTRTFFESKPSAGRVAQVVGREAGLAVVDGSKTALGTVAGKVLLPVALFGPVKDVALNLTALQDPYRATKVGVREVTPVVTEFAAFGKGVQAARKLTAGWGAIPELKWAARAVEFGGGCLAAGMGSAVGRFVGDWSSRLFFPPRADHPFDMQDETPQVLPAGRLL